MSKEKKAPKSRGFGFVEMPDEAQALDAIAALNAKEFMGRPLNVEIARPKEEAKISAGDLKKKRQDEIKPQIEKNAIHQEEQARVWVGKPGTYKGGRRTRSYVSKHGPSGIHKPASSWKKNKDNPMRWRKDTGQSKPWVKKHSGHKTWEKPEGESKPWTKTEGGSKPWGKSEGGYKPWVKREGGFKPWEKSEGGHKPWVKREGGFKPWEKPEGKSKPWDKAAAIGGSKPRGRGNERKKKTGVDSLRGRVKNRRKSVRA